MTTELTGSKRRALRLNIWLLKLSRHWLRVALIIIGIYATLPWVAPTLMHFGLTEPAHVLYFMYGPFCHQFAFRSFFLYGDQIAYPRAISGTTLTPYETYVMQSPEFDQALSNWVGQPGRSTFQSVDQFDPYLWTYDLQFASKDFFGDPQMGYKLTLCERDIAIYTMLFVGGLIYSIPVVRRRLRPIPIWLYVILGVDAHRHRRFQPTTRLSALQLVGAARNTADFPGRHRRLIRLDERMAGVPLPRTLVPRYKSAACGKARADRHPRLSQSSKVA